MMIISKNTSELIQRWSSTSERGACPSVWLVYLVRLTWRNSFFLETGSQLEIASWLGMGDRVHSPIAALEPDLVWTRADPVCDATVSVSSGVHHRSCGSEDSFLGVCHPSCLLSPLPLLFPGIPEPWFCTGFNVYIPPLVVCRLPSRTVDTSQKY